MSFQEGENLYECKSCKKSLSSRRNLKNHIASVHKGEKPYKCEICNRSFPQKYPLRRHIDSVHNGKKPYTCENCDEKFSQKNSLQRHILTFHELDNDDVDEVLKNCNSNQQEASQIKKQKLLHKTSFLCETTLLLCLLKILFNLRFVKCTLSFFQPNKKGVKKHCKCNISCWR